MFETNKNPLKDLLADENIYVAHVDGHHKVTVQKRTLEEYPQSFLSDGHLRECLQEIYVDEGFEFDSNALKGLIKTKNKSVVEWMRMDGCTYVSISKSNEESITFKHLLDWNFLSEDIETLLKECVSKSLTILVSGNSTFGRTSVLSALVNEIPADERSLLVETNGLDLPEHPTSSKVMKTHGTSTQDLKDLYRSSSFFNPNRLVVSQLGNDAGAWVQTVGDGLLKGSMASVLCQSPQQALDKVLTSFSGENSSLSEENIAVQVASAIDIIVQVNRLEDGSNKIVLLTETERDGDKIRLTELYKFVSSGFDEKRRVIGNFISTGLWSKKL